MTKLDRRNIVLIVFDTLSEQDCCAFIDDLPVLSGLRKSSLCFDNAYATSPESGPARASLFTGLDMAAHGVWTDGVALPARETTLPQRLADCGYLTWLVGRRQLAGVSRWTTEHARPFEYARLDWAHGPLHRSRQNAYLAWLQETAPETYLEIFPSQADPDDTAIPEQYRVAMAALPDELSFNSWVGARVCDHLAEHSGEQPFFGIAGFVVGETMGAAPGTDAPCERLDARALRQADAALGHVMQCLKSRELAEDTAVVVTAARGSVADKRPPMRESAIKVPFMIRSPGGAVRTVKSAVSTIDVAPTLYDLAQVPPALRMQGTSLLTDGPDAAARGWALSRLRNPDHGWKTALCMGQWKLVMSHGYPDAGDPPKYSFYNLQADPDEIRDLAATEARQADLDEMIDLMIDARVALEDRTEPRIAKF